MKIIDAHVYYYEPSRPDRPWDLSAPFSDRPPFPVERLLQDQAAAGVDEVVDITPVVMGFDNRYALEEAARQPQQIAGVMARFDVQPPRLAERLDALRQQPGFLGVRLTLNSPPFDRLLDGDALSPLLHAAAEQRVPVALFAPGRAAGGQHAARDSCLTRKMSMG